MADAGVKIQGAKQLRASLKRAGVDMEDMKDANAAVGALVAEAAAAQAPRRTGKLAASVRGNRAAGRAQVLAGRATIPYAGPIHWGWAAHNIDPNPFMSVAAQDTEPIWVERYTDAISRIIDKVKGAT